MRIYQQKVSIITALSIAWMAARNSSFFIGHVYKKCLFSIDINRDSKYNSLKSINDGANHGRENIPRWWC